ncbi:leucine-rich repeat-containing protein 40-like isoform X2 [Chrysoperla carnea]|nr:leucine-rich repeat-containing protein 40-like isoform X2 [Chrysoperla carnea]
MSEAVENGEADKSKKSTIDDNQSVNSFKSSYSARSKISHLKRPNVTSAFHRQTKEEECALITPSFIKEAQKTGIIKLVARGIHSVPEKIWKIQELQVANTEDQYRFDRKQDLSWWNQTPVFHLDLSSNTISEISKDIQLLEDLVYLNLHDNCLTKLPEEIGNLSKLAKLDLSRNKIAVFPIPLCKLVELTTLNMSHNHLTHLHQNFTDLIMLEFLDLSENKINKLPRGMGFLIRLVDLNLSHNVLTSLPLDIVNLRDLTKLDISYNNLKLLPEMGELRSLEYLYANNNNLIKIPSMTGCNNLKECYFGFNEIEALHSDMYHDMRSVKILDLPNNKLEEIPEGISVMQNLIRLNLQNNSLIYLPNTLCLLPHLQTLTVDGNKFRTLRRDIIQCGTSRILKFLRERYDSDMEQLKNFKDIERKQEVVPGDSSIFPDRYSMKISRSLNIANKELSYVPDSVFEDFAQVQADTIDICKNDLTQVPNGIGLTKDTLVLLNLSANKITELPDFLSECIHLKYINLSKNLITEIPSSYSNLKQLRELNLSNNRFQEISKAIYGIERLEILNLSNNQITSIDAESLQALKNLAILDLMNNSITHVPPILGHMKQLRALELVGNSFRQPSHAVLQKGTESLLAYLRDKIPT